MSRVLNIKGGSLIYAMIYTRQHYTSSGSGW